MKTITGSSSFYLSSGSGWSWRGLKYFRVCICGARVIYRGKLISVAAPWRNGGFLFLAVNILAAE